MKSVIWIVVFAAIIGAYLAYLFSIDFKQLGMKSAIAWAGLTLVILIFIALAMLDAISYKSAVPNHIIHTPDNPYQTVTQSEWSPHGRYVGEALPLTGPGFPEDEWRKGP